MGAPSLAESFDLLRFSDAFHSRLTAAREELNARPGFEREKQWLDSAVELVSAERRPVAALLERARCLPELAEAAAEMASVFQDTWVDALEKLLAGIMFHAGSRSPVIEALFPHQKFAALRRAGKELAIAYSAELERRLKTGYVTRMMQAEEFGFAQAVLDQIALAYGKWHSCFVPPPMPEEESARLREELPGLARRMELAMGQARLLAEAALLPFDGLYDGTSLNAKPRKRASRMEAMEAALVEAGQVASEPGSAASEPPEPEPLQSDLDTVVEPPGPAEAAPPSKPKRAKKAPPAPTQA